MEGEITAEIGMGDGVVLSAVLVGGIDGFHTHIKAQDEIVEIEADAQAIRHGNLLVEGIDLELTSWLVGIITQCPDITTIEEERTIEFPEEVRAVFKVEVEFHVTRLVDEVDGSIVALERSRSESADAPSTDGVGAT